MKNKTVIIIALILFLLVNTSYFWEGQTGNFMIPIVFLLFAVYAGLVITFLNQCYQAVRERFKDRARVYLLLLLALVTGLIYLKPDGLIDFEKLAGRDLLIAGGEGSANCRTVLRLKDNHRFREKRVCFGLYEIKGSYRMTGDTVWFENIEKGRGAADFYEFAVIKPSVFYEDSLHKDLVLFKDRQDTAGSRLFITKNELINLNSKR